jgi:DNA-binding CsgD family transcriptional regulator
MTRAEKRAAALRAITAHPTASNREIGRIIGVDGKTVTALRNSVIPHSAEIHQPAEIQIPHPEPETPQCGNSNSAAASGPYSAESETPQPAENEKISQIPHFTTPLDAITAQVPRAKWHAIGMALVRGEAVPAEIKALVATLSTTDQEALGWALVKAFRAKVPKPPKAKKVNQRRLSVAVRARVIELRRAGQEFRDIADGLGIKPSTARGIVQREAPELVTREVRHYTDEQRAEVVRLRQQSLLHREIGEQVGLTDTQVKTICAAAGLATKREAR